MKINNILDVIGNTPTVKINKTALLAKSNPKVNIFAKLESQNPGGSIKDRVALNMINEAEKSGVLTKEKTVIEASSGNTGIGLAMVGAVKGYKVMIVLPESSSKERLQILRAYGAELILTPASEKTDGARKKVKYIISQNPDKYYNTDQYSNMYNPIAHYEQTAEEIIQQMDGNIDAFVASIGTSGTLMGIGRRLKEYNSNIKIILAEPPIGHKIPGLRNYEESSVPKIFDRSIIDKQVTVMDKDAIWMVKALARSEGILVGVSSGVTLWAAMQESQHMKKGNIVVIFPDRGERYLSMGIFD